MQVHTFRAESLQAALQQVRNVLGPDASILHTREKRSGRLGLFAKTTIEVEATLDMPVPSHFGIQRPVDSAGSQQHLNADRSIKRTQVADRTGDTVNQAGHRQQNGAGPPADKLSAGSDVREHTKHVSKSASPSNSRSPEQTVRSIVSTDQGSYSNSQPDEKLSAAMLEVQADLLSNGMQPSTVSRLMREVIEHAGELSAGDDSGRGAADPLDDPWALRGRIGQRIAACLKVSGSIELSKTKPYVIALVGPTGVGKTTTLAKIAAGFRFDLGCRIGLIALDTFRLGAVDQLLQYAELISASLEVVSSPEQVTGALKRLNDCDLILLDTAGRAPRDAEQLVELGKFLELARPHSTQLVVSATSSTAHVAQTVERFSLLKPTNLLITKLDEAVDFGSWLPLLDRITLPVSYLTHGQQVPQDIMVASARRLASMLVGQLHPHVGHAPQPQVA